MAEPLNSGRDHRGHRDRIDIVSVFRSQLQGLKWDHRDQTAAPVPLVPPAGSELGPEKQNEINVVPLVPVVPLKNSGGEIGTSADGPVTEAVDVFEERAAIREMDGGQSREEAEEGALAELTMETGEDPDDLRQRLEAARGAPPLDAGGLPDKPCRLCGHPHHWKPAEAPFEGPGWHCAGCRPAPAGRRCHAVTVPGPGAVPASTGSTAAAGLTMGQLRAEMEKVRKIYADCGFAPPADTEYALRAMADTLGVTAHALRQKLGMKR